MNPKRAANSVSHRRYVIKKSALVLASGAFSLVAACSSAGPADDGASTIQPPFMEQDGGTASSVSAAPVDTESHAAWRRDMARSPLPKEGCFRVMHPSTTWEEVPCVTAPPDPRPPTLDRVERAPAVHPEAVTTDIIASAPGLITLSQGSFPSVTGVTSASNWSLQLNTNTSPPGAGLCAKVPDKSASSCVAWQQYVYEPASGTAFIQYWLVNATTCPTGSGTWNLVQPAAATATSAASAGGCYQNSQGLNVGSQPITNLANLSLTGTAGSSDTFTMATGPTTLFSSKGLTSVVGLNTFWRSSEFNVFGNSNGSKVVFNNGATTPAATIVVQTLTDSPTPGAPTCQPGSFTAETSSLNLVANSCCPVLGASPGIRFEESSSTTTAPQACAIPVVTSLSPSSGPNSGGNRVTINGLHFDTTGKTQVTLGSYAATNVTCATSTQCVVTMPLISLEPWPLSLDVKVTVGAQSSPAGPQDVYTYNAGPNCSSTYSCAGHGFGFPSAIVTCTTNVTFYDLYGLSGTTPVLVGTGTTATYDTNDVGSYGAACNSAGSCSWVTTYEQSASYCGAVPPREPPPSTCNGEKHSTAKCTVGWTCCGSDGWACGHCQ